MMHKVVGAVLVLCILVGVIAGCRSAKKIRKVISVPRKDTMHIVADTLVTIGPNPDPKADSIRAIHQILASLEKRRIDFQTFSAKMKVHYEGGDGKGYEFNAYIHIKKDSIIWISVTYVLGIEAFRMLITPDSVKIIDKLKKVVMMRSVSFLQYDIHLPVDFRTLQDLLIGNPIFLDTSSIIFYKKEQTAISLMSIGNLFKNYISLNPGDNSLRHSKLDDADVRRARTCDLTYGDYEQRDSILFSTHRKISVAEKSKLDIEINYKQYNFNEPLGFPFSVPKNYKRR